MIEAIIIGIATAIWRYYDGSDKRWKSSNLYALALVVASCLVAYGPWILDPMRLGAVSVAGLVVARLMTAGMPGFTNYCKNPHGRGMVLSYAMPTAVFALGYSFFVADPFWLIPFGVSGTILTLTYVELSKLEKRRKLPFFYAEEWGRLSYGFIMAGLCLI